MAKFKLAAAIAAFKRGTASRNISYTEQEIEKFINSQIKYKQEEIDELKKDLEQTSEENYMDFKESLVTGVDEDAITKRPHRKEVAETFVAVALGRMASDKAYVTKMQNRIKNLEEEIVLLKDLSFELENLEIKVEEEN
jgi:hypothetical protein